MAQQTEVPLWINGQRKSASDQGTFEVRSPLTGEITAKSASATSQDCKEAIEAAANAFKTWEFYPVAKKRAIFYKAAELIQSDKYKAKISQALKDETASISIWADINIAGSVNNLLEAASLASQIKGETFQSNTPGAHCIVQRRAHGVILAIAPWNAPATLSFRAICIPLICGNTVVLKSSEYSPISQEIVVEIMHEAGIPPGVLSYISMSRDNSPKLTSELIGHPAVRHINVAQFTGSDRVGRIIAGEAAKYLKPCVFELGGKAAAVVLDDADIDTAARCIAQGSMLHSGQICMSTERVIVMRRVAEAFKSKLSAIVSKLKSGDPFSDPSVRLSALFSEGSAENVVNMIKEAKDDGAQVILGDLSRQGALVQPHLVVGVKPGMRLWDRESFGPVVAITVVDTVDEAVELANETDYTLTAAIWTKNVNRALDVAARVRSGCTSINGGTMHSEPGLGHAGLGGATGYGRFDIDNFTIKRMIVIHPDAPARFPLVDGL